MKDEYPDLKQDLYGAFVQRGVALADPQGLLAIVIGDTWMSIKSFETLRSRLLDGHAFDSFVHMRDSSNHPDIFGANAAFVLSMAGKPSRRAPFIRLESLGQERKEQDLRVALVTRTAESGFHLAAGEDFRAIPGSPIVYWLSEKMRAVFQSGSNLGDVVTTREGLTTGDNNRFLRFWWEPSAPGVALPQSFEEAPPPGKRWFAYLKGGTERCWSGNFEYVVDWERDGERQRVNIEDRTGRVRSHNYNGEWAFRAGITWTGLTSGRFCGRAMGKGFMFDAKGPVAFPRDDGARNYLLSILNSSVGTTILKMLAPTMDFKLGQVEKVPLPAVTPDKADQLGLQGEALIAMSASDWDAAETAWGFTDNPLVTIARHRDA